MKRVCKRRPRGCLLLQRQRNHLSGFSRSADGECDVLLAIHHICHSPDFTVTDDAALASRPRTGNVPTMSTNSTKMRELRNVNRDRAMLPSISFRSASQCSALARSLLLARHTASKANSAPRGRKHDRHAKPDIRGSINSTYVRTGTRLPLSTVAIGNNRWPPVRLPS